MDGLVLRKYTINSRAVELVYQCFILMLPVPLSQKPAWQRRGFHAVTSTGHFLF